MIPHEHNLAPLEETLGVTFKNKVLLLRAVTHRSYLNENREERALGNNELLEFLGDAVLELIVTEYLVRNYPTETEGNLTTLRSNLVCTEALIEVGEVFELSRYLRCSRGERAELEKSVRRRKMFADVFEAIIGAIYQDRGMMTAAMFVLDTVMPRLEEIRSREGRDPKSLIQELVQAREGITPHYVTLGRDGPDHVTIWSVALHVGTRRLATGSGYSRKDAETAAAAKALIDYMK